MFLTLIMLRIINQMEHLHGSEHIYRVSISSIKAYSSAKVENTIKLITIIRMEHRRGSGD